MAGVLALPLLVLQAQITSTLTNVTGSWISGDIGAPGANPGTATWMDTAPAGLSLADVFTLTSSAPNVGGTADNFRYACPAPVVGDRQLTINIATMTGAPFAQSGIMVREALGPDAVHAYLFRFPTSNTLQQKIRRTPGGPTSSAASGLPGDTHPWLRIARVGNSFSFLASPSGEDGSWIAAMAPTTIEMAPTAFWCLVINSVAGQEAVQASATIDDVSLTDVSDTPPPDPEPPPAGKDYGGLRPHYQGFGAASLGGAGDPTKVLCVVTSRASTGGAPASAMEDAHTAASGSLLHYHGTFSQCTQGLDTSYVVFDVSGYLELGGCRDLTSPYLTIAGQTAPAPGVALRNGCVRVDHRDQVFQHVRLRCGAAQGSVSLYIRGAKTPVLNTVLDHVSIAWCGAAGVGVNVYIGGSPSQGQAPQDTLIVDSIIAEQLGIAAPKGQGLLTYAATNGTLTLARTYFAHNGNRMPWIGAGYQAAVLNTYGYNAHSQAGGDGTYGAMQVIGEDAYVDSLVEAAFVGNVVQVGPSSIEPDGTLMVRMDPPQVAAGGAKIYFDDNAGPGILGPSRDDQWAGVSYQEAATRANSECDDACLHSPAFSWFTSVNYDVLPHAQVKAYLDLNAGAWPTSRDALDTRVLHDKDDGGTSDIKHESEVGGFDAVPLAQNTRTVVFPANPFASGDCGTKTGGTARLMIECWLEHDPTFGARRLEPVRQPVPEGRGPITPVVIGLLVLGIVLLIVFGVWQRRRDATA